jgi:hypothetical protein
MAARTTTSPLSSSPIEQIAYALVPPPAGSTLM